MNKVYVAPECEVVCFTLEMNVMSKQGSGQDLGDPDYPDF